MGQFSLPCFLYYLPFLTKRERGKEREREREGEREGVSERVSE